MPGYTFQLPPYHRQTLQTVEGLSKEELSNLVPGDVILVNDQEWEAFAREGDAVVVSTPNGDHLYLVFVDGHAVADENHGPIPELNRKGVTIRKA